MILLGYAGKLVKEGLTSPFTSYIGGRLISLNNSLPPDNLKTCVNCRNPMHYSLQLYCPVSENGDHRSLYFFVCLRKACQSIGKCCRVLRCQTSATVVSDVCDVQDAHNPWLLDEDVDDEVETELETLDSVSLPERTEKMNISHSPGLGGPFVCRYLDVYEDDENGVLLESLEGNADEEKDVSGEHGMTFFDDWLKLEEIENAFVEEDDNASTGCFTASLQMHLVSREAYGCEVIRYHWGGRPIFDGNIPRELVSHLVCSYCGSRRVYEAQLFPSINNSLALSKSTDSHSSEVGELDTSWLLRFTTALVFSCANSCWTSSDDWKEECIVVQLENKNVVIHDA